MNPKRATFFSGNYGSGKTCIAVSYAIMLANLGKKVSIYDMDIVNPYFRTIDASAELSAAEVDLVVSPYAETNVDIPALNAAAYKMVDDLARFAVIDIGGDERGALALGRYSQKIVEENNYDMLFVVNRFRPETRTVSGAMEIKKAIEDTCKIKFTGIVNNPNLGAETTIDAIESSNGFIRELSKTSGLPIVFTAVEKKFVDKISWKGEVFGIDVIKYGEWCNN